LPSPRTRDDQRRLQLAQEGGVVRELVGDPRADAGTARAGGAVGEIVELRGALLHGCVALRHRFRGGCSPVATRQIEDATRRATTAAAAVTAA
jgi:hypothetical protein